MRTPITLLVLLAFLNASAQADLNQMIQERMQQQGMGGMRMEDDNDPFVPNTFVGSFRMEMHNYKGAVEQQHSPMNMRFWSTTDMTLVQMQMPAQQAQQMKMLTDHKGKWTYMLMTDEKGAKRAMKSKKKKVVMTSEPTTPKKEPVITVTKETKVIDGQTCTKVIAVSEDGTWTGWVARTVESPFGDLLRSMQQRGADSHMTVAKSVQGMPLEYEWIDAKTKDRLVCHIRELQHGKVDASAFSLVGYEVMEMPSFGR